MNYEKEIWKDIPEIENYQVSNYGRVRSMKRKAPRILSQTEKHDGYMQVGLYINKKQKFFLVHRLVAMAFIPNPENKPTVDHIDRIRNHNYPENLRWMTMDEQKTNKTPMGEGQYLPSQNKIKKGERIFHEDVTFNVKCVETGVIYENSNSAAEWILNQGLTSSSRKGYVAERIRFNARGYKGRDSAFGYHWKFVIDEED